MNPLFHPIRFLFGSPTRISVFTNTTGQLLGRLFQSAVTFTITLLLANTYGPRGFGDYTKVLAFVPLFYLIADFGMNALYVKESQSRKVGAVSFQTLASTRFVLSAVLIILSLAVLAVLPTDGSRGFTPFVKIGILIFLPSIIFQSLVTTANAAFQKFRRYVYSTAAIAAGSLIALTGTFAAIHMNPDHTGLWYALVALTTGSFVTAAVSLFFALRLTGRIMMRIDIRSTKKLLILSAPLALTLVCNLLYSRADVFILTYMRSTQEVGIYGFAYRFFEFTLVIPTFFMNAVFPILAIKKIQTSSAMQADYRRIVLKSGKILFAASFVIAYILWFMAPLLGFARPEFAGSVPLLRILSYGVPFFFLSSLTMWMIITESKYRQLASIYFLSMVVNITANILLIPRYGMYAAAWVTTGSEILTLALSLLYLKHLAVVSGHPARVQ